MAQESLITYIKQARSQGTSDEAIRSTLLQNGWQNEDVDLAIATLVLPLPVTSPNTTKFNKKYVLSFAFLLFLFFSVISGIFVYFSFRQSSSNQQTKAKVNDEGYTPTNSALPKRSDSVIAFVQMNNEEVNNTLVYKPTTLGFYSIDKKQKLPSIPELEIKEYGLHLLGQWSPDGKYLPILTITGPKNQNPSFVSLYLYDQITHSAKRLFHQDPTLDPSRDKYLWFNTSFPFSAHWLDSKTLALNRKPLDDQIAVVNSINIDGEFKEEKRPNKIVEKNEIISITHSTSDLKPEKIYVKNQQLGITVQGNPIGVLDNLLVTLEQATGPNLLDQNDPQTQEALKKMEELKAQGLSEKEISERTLQIIEPTSDSALYFINVINGETVKKISLADKPWKTRSVQIHPASSFLIAHQVDQTTFPKNERFLRIDPSSEKTEVLFQNALPQRQEMALGALLESGSSFNISQNGKWIISYIEGSKPPALSDGIVMRNIDTKETVSICTGDCHQLRVYNPIQLFVTY